MAMTENSFDFDVIIIGSGPAGMFAALELKNQKPQMEVAILEKGIIRPQIKPEDKKALTSGWGGSGTFSDGKLDLTPKVGGQLEDFIGADEFGNLMKYVDEIYQRFGGRRTLINPLDPKFERKVKGLVERSSRVGLKIAPYPIRHLGTENVYLISENIRHHLEEKGVKIFINTRAKEINFQNGILSVGAEVCDSQQKMKFTAKNVVVAPGRSGMEEWFMAEMKRLGIPYKIGGVDVGVRVEVLAKTLKEITDIFHEIKIYYQSPKHKDRVRTFCMCPYGFVVMEKYHGLTIVNGHSYQKKGKRSLNTNFAILVTQNFTKPFNDPIVYGRGIVHQANELAGGKVLVQRLGDIWRGGRSHEADLHNWIIKPTLKEAVPGDITLGGIPPRHLEGVLQMLAALDEIAPGINSAHTLLYVPEVKFYSVRVECDPKKGFETTIPGLHIIGDGAGRTRGLLQSSMEGVIAARAIVEKFKK